MRGVDMQNDYRTNMNPESLAAWDRLVQKYGALDTNSTYRSPERNAAVGGAKNSLHMAGEAFDISTRGMDQAQREALIAEARASGFQGIGVYDNALHVDTGPERAWGADYTRGSLPEWAGGPVSAPVGQYAAQQAEPQAQQMVPQPPQQQQMAQMPQQQANALAQFQAPQMDVRNFLTPPRQRQRLSYT